MRATANIAPTRNGKRRLLESCAIVAGLAALAYGGPALAQVAGTGQAVTGPGLSTPTISAPGPGPTIVNTTGDQTIINWTPSNTPVGGVIDFLPTGNSLNFTGTGQYIVLNRFISGGGTPIADQIAINGTVNSVDFATSGGRGGNIWFYNAGGILIGATGVINVGSLVLTANDIDTTSGLLGSLGEIRFRGAAGSTSAITVNGAINANNAFSPGSSYVALVAPRVVQAGAVRVDGSVGYVAAEQADITINGGLFDINVSVGAEGGNIITHTGTTGGPGHVDSNPNDSRVYMVAIPKNLAVTMLVSGQIGYDAVSAQADPNGAVRLSAGYNITNGEVADTPVNATAANITAGDTLFSSSVVARASGTFAGRPDNMIPPSTPPTPQTGKIIVRGDADFGGDAGATLTAGADQAIEVDGALTLQSLGQLQSDGSRQGGNAALSVLGGSVTAGAITVASIGAGDIGTSGDGGNGVGGDATVLISGTGSALTANGLNIQSTGIGGGVTFDSGGLATAVDNGGNGTGGNTVLTVENGGALSVNGSLSVASTGIGQTGNIQSGDGAGGTARISVTGAGTLVNALNTSVTADGVGGTAISQSLADVTTENAGSGSGGSAAIAINANNTATIDLGAAGLSANGIGGDSSEFEGSTGGDGIGGAVSLSVDDGIAVDMNDLVLSAVARSGAAGSPSNISAISGDSLGGTVTITVANGSGIINDGNTSINVSGFTGFGDSIGNGTGGDVVVSATMGGVFSTDGNVDINAAGGNFISSGTFNAGAATGGDVDLTADGGTITAGSFFVDAGAQRPNADNGASAVNGGTIDLLATNNGTISATNSGGFNNFSASASSGSAPNDVFATGGTIQAIADGGTISMANFVSFSATGVSGGNFSEGAAPLESGVGGTVLIRVRNSTTGTGSMTFDDLFLDAIGDTQSFSEGINAGNGATGAVGGTATFDMQSGSFTATELNISADGFGGSVAGTGRGGTASFTQTGGTVTVGTLSVSASGRGGFDPTVSGVGIGGTATINLFGGTLTGGNVSASANGRGGNGANGDDDDPANPTPTGTGGIGQGGIATINIEGTAVIDTTTLAAYANGQGGQGGSYFVDTVPGDGGDAGDGIGGTATINITTGALTTGDLIVDASSIGGEGGDILASSSSGSVVGIGAGGAGGNGRGGTATLDFATSFTASGTVISASTGSGGAGGFGTVGGSGGGGAGGLAQVIVSDFDAGALSLTVNASAIGGSGGFSDDGAGGNGGSATGGTGRIEADGANANIAVSQANFVTNAIGGSGTLGRISFFSEETVGATGGNGGDGTGGTVEVVASNGATVAIGPDTSGVIALGSAGTGGSGGSGAFNNFGGMRFGGDGGTGGGGIGGTVRLSANGGTITSNGNAVDINVSGLSGLGGTGGTGSAGNGANGGSLGTTGGRAIIAALGTSSGAGAIDLGTTTIAANGDAAGRIEIRTDGNISFASLTAEALGTAPPTNNDTDEAPAGIFFAATGGTITTTGDMTLTTGSSFGAYGQSNGTITVGGDLTIDSGDQIDIRHDFPEGNAPTIAAAGNLTAIAGGISGAPGSLLDAGGTLSLTSTLGSIGVDQLDANNIVIAAAGAASVEHAEADNDFIASGASFRTGLNSIITGGDIVVASPGAVDLGNSTAGGFVQANGQSIAFNNIDAGSSVFLTASGNTAGAEGITGGSIDAGGSINLNATGIAINGEIAGGGTLFANGSAGPVAIALANMGDFISISATGDITGTYNTPNSIRLTSGANIGASANATGFESSSSGTPIAASVYVDADGDVVLANSSATGMFGVRAGGSASVNGANIGEDLLVLAGTTATLTDITAGDDLTVTAPGGIVANGLTTTGIGPDDGTLTYGPFSPSGPSFFQDNFSPPNQSNIVLTASAGNIGGDDMNAFNNLTVTASGAVDLGSSSAGAIVQANGQSILFDSVNAGASVFLTATGTTPGAEGISGGSIDAGSDINLAATLIAIDGTLAAGGSLFASGSAGPVGIALANIEDNIFVSAAGDITGTYNAEGNIRLTSDANISASANATGFESSSSGTPITASVYADADGDVVMTNSSATGMFGVRAGGSALITGANVGEDLLVLAGTTATLANITAGDDLTAIATGGIVANGLITTGTGRDDRSLIYGPGSPVAPPGFQINASPPNQSNIVLTTSAGSISGGDMDAFDNLALNASGAVNTTGTLASGLATTITGDSIAFAAIDAGSTVNLTATNAISGADIAAGSDINLVGDSIALSGAVTGGANFFAFGLGGAVAVNNADVAGTISIFADGNLTGTYVAGGDIRLNSNANVDASATANGGFADPSGIPTQGNLYVEAAGNVVLANSAAARMFGVSAGGSATISGGNAGEDVLVIAATNASLNGVTAGDDVDVRTGGDLTATGVSATGVGVDTAILGFAAGNGFTISSGEGVSATNGSDIILSAGGAIGASALSAGDDIFATTPGAIAINGATTLGLGATGGSSDIRTQGGDTTLAALNAFTDVLVAATGAFNATGTVAAGRNIAVTATSANLETLASPGGSFVSTLDAGANLSVITSGDIIGGRVRAGGDLTLTGDSIDIARAQTTGAGQLTLTGTNGVNSTNIQAGGATLLNASNGAVTSDGLISTGPVTATGDSINLRTGGNIVFAVLDADVGDAVVASQVGSLTITSGVVAGRAALTSSSGDDIIISQLAANAADISTEGEIFVNGMLTARNIALQSNDIIIASGARVGTAGSTESLSIENNDVFSQTFVGGTGTRAGFHLDAAELTQLFGSNIEVFAPEVEAANSASVGSSSPPDVIVDSFTLAGGAAGSNLGANGALTIRTPGKMRVIGNVQLTGLSDTNALNLFADDALEVILGQGTVRLVNGSNAAGQLNMVSEDIIVATTAAINDVGAATTTDAIETRLAQNDGVVLNEGSLFARGIRAEVVGGFYVQNSGSGTEFANRRGLTFGAGGLDVLTEGTSRIVVNGVQIGPNGQVTGIDTVPLLTIGGSAPTAGSFDPRSTFNGCFIANPAACGVLPPPEPEFESSFPVQDVIEEEADAEDEDGNGQSLPVPLITMRDLDPLSGEPLLDDPVTGAGNDDLWTPTLDECDPAGTCPAAE
jgi:hypothetical protein